MFDVVGKRFQSCVGRVDSASLRFVERHTEKVSVRQGVLEPVFQGSDCGVMIEVRQGTGIGYCATNNLTESGIREALRMAERWARRTAGRMVLDARQVPAVTERVEQSLRPERPMAQVGIDERIELCQRECERLQVDSRIVDAAARLWWSQIHCGLITTDGGRIEQSTEVLIPELRASANDGGKTQTRTFGESMGRQGGLEILDHIGFYEQAPRVAQQALELLSAPNCPTGTMDVVLAPDQMILQIHESIGHPLELDRILGDERNYAGTTFVTMDMFGSFQYGSPLLNITFDPTRPEQIASYEFDDEGTRAQREVIIKDGVLLRPLGGKTSQTRAGMAGVANAQSLQLESPAH